ncbi:E3 ubiquitin-protein ligase Jade-2 [Aplochiton taeniatus]
MWIASNDLLISVNRLPSRIEDVSPQEADCDRGEKMESGKKRRKYSSSSSNDSDTTTPTDSQVTPWTQGSMNAGTCSPWPRHEHKKPSEVFRTDFITAMKMPDSTGLGTDDFYLLSDPWRQEWEKGVQVPANLEAIPQPVVRLLPEESSSVPLYWASQQDGGGPPSQPHSRYDLDDLDVTWLELVNAEFRLMALPELDELTMERVVVELEGACEESMRRAIETEEGLGIEYDEDVVCDVCRSPEGEDGNEMVFCDKCNICVHQACYGILKVPQGNWLCRTCALGVQPKCLLCPKRGGALKPTRSGTKWVHVSCALWIPEVSIGCPEKMEPITKVSHIPASRWALSCSLCREHTGTCIQCSMPACVVAFHVTCAFDHGLEMRTILAENDEVRFKSYCLGHSVGAQTDRSPAVKEPRPHPGAARDPPGPAPADGFPVPPASAWSLAPAGLSLPERAERDQLEREKAGQRKQKLQELEDEFYRLVEPREVAESLALPAQHVDFLYQFWKLRRKANFNRPLVTARRDEVDDQAQQEQDVLYRRLKLFTHLRQDLERVRNLCYMVSRREKMKSSLCDLQENIFKLQIQLLEEDLAGEKTVKGEKGRQNGVKERGKERRKNSPEKKKERWKSENTSLLKQLGFPKSFPLDNSLFDSWLAQSVQITADDMLGQWALDGQHKDKSASLLSRQLLQGEESLLSLMMDHSMKSTWKTPQLGRKPRGGKSRARSAPQSSSPTLPPALAAAVAPSTAGSRAPAKGPPVPAPAPPSEERCVPAARRGEKSRGSSRALHHHHHLHPTRRRRDPQQDPPPQPPTSKMDSCHISEERGPWDSVPNGSQATAASPPQARSPGGEAGGGLGPRGGLRLRLTRLGKARGRVGARAGRGAEVSEPPPSGKNASLSDATETDGYFSDGEQSDSDTRPGGRKLRLPQLHSGSEDLLRRSVLAL